MRETEIVNKRGTTMKNKVKKINNSRPFEKVYHDLLESELFDWKEKRIFIILKKFADKAGQCFPSLKTLCKLAQLCKNTVLKALKGLEAKKVVIIQKRKNKNGKSMSNLYTLRDEHELWIAESVDQSTETVYAQELQLFALAKNLGYRIEKEPGTTASSPQDSVVPSNNSTNANNLGNNLGLNHNVQEEKSQEVVMCDKRNIERYSLDQIHQFFDYDALLIDHPFQKRDIDSVMSVLHTALNTNKSTIRIAGQERPIMTVIGKLMQLNKEYIMYAIDKYSEQTGRIRNPISYMLTILYNAPEQRYLDVKNQVMHDMCHESEKREEERNCQSVSSRQYAYDNGQTDQVSDGAAYKCNPSEEKRNYHSILSCLRKHDYDQLERELLKC